MFRTVVRIDGMMCGMCEAHVNDAVRNKINVRKISSSHKKGEAVIISDDEITAEQLNSALDGSGYTVAGFGCEPYVKKGLFGKR